MTQSPRFTFTTDPTVWGDVNVTVGCETLGTFRARFRVLRHSKLAQMQKDHAQGTDFAHALLASALREWTHVRNQDGTEFAFNQKNVHELLDFPPIRLALVHAYNATVMGYRTKN